MTSAPRIPAPYPGSSSSPTLPRRAWESWERPVYGLLLAWFAARVAYLAFQLHPYVPPDEITHFGRVLAYAKVWGVPANAPGDYHLGLLDHRPWLYYWTLARGMSLDVFGLHDLVFARLLNGVLGLATVAVGIAWMRSWCSAPWARALFAVLLSNTLMFTGLSASVSYDNGANLLAAVSLLAFTRFRQERSAVWLLGLAAALLLGCLAKRTFLPLAAGIVLLGVAREWRALPALAAGLGSGLSSPADSGPQGGRLRLATLLATVVLLAGFVLALYGGNVLRYGKLRPGFDQVVGEQNAMQNRVYARSRIVDDFREGRIPIEEAKARAAQIRHGGDRGDTLFLLRSAQLPESSVMGRVPYVSAWSYSILKTSVGYLGHRRAVKSDNDMIAYALVFGVAGLLLLRRWRPGAANGVPADAALLALGYALVLMWLVNYPNYQTYRYIELALQGRYMFPVLLPICGLVAWALGELAPARARPWLCGATAALYLYGDLPWFLAQIDERWFMPS